MRGMSPEVGKELQRLFGEGTVAGMTDAQLIQRFVSQRDELAFSALVSRHGPMVLGVCRGVVGDEHEAEDAFQATFLVLARKARSLRVDDSLGGWLHRVGRRIAVETNRRSARRRKVEQGGHSIEVIAKTNDATRGDLVAALHEEIDRLPAKYRDPIVLCDLQSLTRDEVASRLGWPAGTVAGRLARARTLLRDRLTRRGLLAAAGALAAPRELSAAVPAQWAEKTASAALAYLSRDHAAVGTVSAAALSLAEGMLTMMRRKMLFKLACVLVPATIAVGVLSVAALADPGPKTTIAGRVSGPGEKPVEGVRVFYSRHDFAKPLGYILQEVTPDPDGQIRFEAPPVTEYRYGPQGMLWAYKPGSLVGTSPVNQGTNPPGVPTPLVVGPPAYTPFEVRDPEGKPVAGAKIEPRGVNLGLSVPDELAKLIGAETVTDAKGRAVLKSFLPDVVASVFVTAPGYGRQEFAFGRREVPTDVRVLSLLPTGRLKGRLTGDPELIRNHPLSVATSNAPRDSFRVFSYEFLTTDDEGRFEAELVTGPLSITGKRDITAPLYFKAEPGLTIEAGKTTEIELAPRKAVRLSGVVREKGTEKPLPGVEVGLTIRGVNTVTTDAEGRYAGLDFAGTTHLVSVVRIPEGYAPLLFVGSDLKFPTDLAEIEMPPIELSPAADIHGIVVDAAGKPVVGAEVTGYWAVNEGPLRHGDKEATVRSGLDGRFTIKQVNLDGAPTLVARHLGLRTPKPVRFRFGGEEPIRLQIDDSRVSSLDGRVVDPNGKPIAGTHVHLRHTTEYVGPGKNQVSKDELVDFSGVVILLTDADGRYRTPRQLDPETSYEAFASLPGFVTAHTDWIKGNAGSFADVTLVPESP